MYSEGGPIGGANIAGTISAGGSSWNWQSQLGLTSIKADIGSFLGVSSALSGVLGVFGGGTRPELLEAVSSGPGTPVVSTRSHFTPGSVEGSDVTQIMSTSLA